ncbi:MAG: type II toxin-antitoxin system RelE/ParE family toxin [bacterium]
MNYSFHPQARLELIDAVEYYEKQQRGLGKIFLEEVYFTVKRILEFPRAWTKFTKNTRRCITNKFPFAIIYQIREDEIFIVAISHLAKKPGYWKDRN